LILLDTTLLMYPWFMRLFPITQAQPISLLDVPGRRFRIT
jgi:hypothetical protein